MSGRNMVACTLYLHAETDKAILVGASPHHRDENNVWLPLSQIEVGETHSIRNPRFGEAPQIAQYLGTAVDLLVPQWLVDKNDLPDDIER